MNGTSSRPSITCWTPEGSPIEPYDETLTDATVDGKQTWNGTVCNERGERGLLDQNYALVFHTGGDYYEELLPLYEDRIDEISIPTRGLRYGETLAGYNERLDTNRDG